MNIKKTIKNIPSKDLLLIGKILNVIDIKLTMGRIPYIMYFAYKVFPNDIERYDINRLLTVCDKQLDIIKFTQITDRAPYDEQEVCIRIENKDKFKQTKNILFESPTNITFNYSSETGMGNTSADKFKLKDDTDYKKVFDECFARRKMKVTRAEIVSMLKIKQSSNNKINVPELLAAINNVKLNRKQSPEEVSITQIINKISKKIRDRTGLNTEQFVNNGGNLTLNI